MTIVTNFTSSTSAADAMDTLNDSLGKIVALNTTIATLNASVTALNSSIAAIQPNASFVSASKSQNEGISSFTFQINLDKTWGSDISFEYIVSGTGANPADGADFVGGVLPRGIVTYAPGVTQATANVLVADDSTVEPNENFIVKLYRIVASSIGTIINDDAVAATTFFGSTSSLWGNSTPTFGATA